MASLESKLSDVLDGPNAADGPAAAAALSVALETAEWAMTNPISLSGSANKIHMGTGVPGAGLGTNGDFFFQVNGVAGAAIYLKIAGVWVPIA